MTPQQAIALLLGTEPLTDDQRLSIATVIADECAQFARFFHHGAMVNGLLACMYAKTVDPAFCPTYELEDRVRAFLDGYIPEWMPTAED